MSSVVIAGDTSGTITLQAPAVSGSTVLTLPAVAGTVVVTGSSAVVSQTMLAAGVSGNGPSFSAYQSSSQTLSSNTWTKINLQTEEWDTNSNFDNTTNYRFTPTVAGYYQVNGAVAILSSNTAITAAIYKNGSSYKISNQSNNYMYIGNVNALVYLNGTTDYIELYCNIGTGQGLTAAASTTYFQAAMVRSA
jgi:hypothetical protein